MEVCTLLLCHGADPTMPNCHSKTTIDLAPTEDIKQKIECESMCMCLSLSLSLSLTLTLTLTHKLLVLHTLLIIALHKLQLSTKVTCCWTMPRREICLE